MAHVTLIDHNVDPIKTIYRAFRTCYSPDTPTTIKCPDEKSMLDFIHKHLDHQSPIEHTFFTFSVEGISRACSHQLVRHRIASYSQQSQRYVKLTQFDYEIPERIAKDPVALRIYAQHMAEAQKTYNILYDLLASKGFNKEQCAEDARYVFPNACHTNIVVTFNSRSLLHFFEERLCCRAQAEIREVALQMLPLANRVLPIFKLDDVMKCGKTCFRCQKTEAK